MLSSSLHEPSDAKFDLEQAFKQFSLETEHLEMTYRNLQERFYSVQQTVQQANIRLAGKLAELDFTSRYLEAILDTISQGILFIDTNGIITTYNAAAQQILQIPAKKLLFRPFQDQLDDEWLGFSIKEALTSQRCPKTIYLSHKRGEEVFELEIEPAFVSTSQDTHSHFQSSPPSIQGLLILLRDMTALRRLQRLASHQDRLKDLGELAAHLAHDIRNPLGGIKGFAAILEQELKDRPDLQQMAAYIVQGANDLNRFVTNVLQYARPFKMSYELVDIVALVEEIRQLILVDAAWNPLIDFSIRADSQAIVVPLDAQHFKSALLNIFVNALQAMPEGGQLRVIVQEERDWIVIKIEDTGAGIAEENLSKIFSPFFTTKEEGNGLGLAEVHKVVQEHQGEISVQSAVGQGTRFTIKLRKHLDGY